MIEIPDAEEALLGSLLIDPKCSLEVSTVTCGVEFQDQNRGKFFDVMVQGYVAGNPVNDFSWLRENLAKYGVAPALCEAIYIARLFQNVPNAANAFFYAEAVHRRFESESLSVALADASRKALEPQTDLQELRGTVEAKLARFGASDNDSPRLIGDVMRGAADRMGVDRDNGLRVFTGLRDLDNFLGPMCSGDMVVVAARPGQGKSAFALEAAIHNASKNRPTLYVSLEMTSEQLALRKLGALAEIDSRVIRNGRLTDDQVRDCREIAHEIDWPLYVWAPHNATMGRLRAQAKMLHARNPLQLVVIDYMQLIRPESDEKRLQRYEQVTLLSLSCKALAKELECPVIVLCQLNREADGNRPKLAHIRESGAIEQDADIILFPYQDHNQRPVEDQDGGVPAEIIIGKQRHGPPGVVACRWISHKTSFANPFREEEAMFSNWNNTGEIPS